ncbi:unnamed protein product, partial [Mesorhabditis belari]|uniref:DUS-like FMN-binding domain-containing protein n=1 Tax=Mesorhabditis belari TaxID=2138241 RepID=A0AAF3E950_9BILA
MSITTCDLSPSRHHDYDLRKEWRFYSAPMVRYSKLPFRKLLRLYDVDCCFTPMIYAENFLESELCRSSEFTTADDDRPLIVQFAARDPVIFASAAELVYKYSSGVDLNCGCPKSDVRSRGFGSSLLSEPELLADIVRHTRAKISDSNFSISLKVRIQYPLEKTIDLCKKAEAAGVSHLTVHGRTPSQRLEPPDYDAIALIKSCINVPIVANGDITSRNQALEILERTKCDGVMSANGLLENPALFAGHESTPKDCIENFLSITAIHGMTYMLFHQHLIMMLRNVLTPPQRKIFNELSSRPAILDFSLRKSESHVCDKAQHCAPLMNSLPVSCARPPTLQPRVRAANSQRASFPPARPHRKHSVEFVDIQEVLQISRDLKAKKNQTGVFPSPVFNDYTPAPSIQIHGPRRHSEVTVLPTKLHTPSRFERFTMSGYRVVRRLKSSLLSCVCSMEADQKCTIGYADLN